MFSGELVQSIPIPRPYVDNEGLRPSFLFWDGWASGHSGISSELFQGRGKLVGT